MLIVSKKPSRTLEKGNEDYENKGPPKTTNSTKNRRNVIYI